MKKFAAVCLIITTVLTTWILPAAEPEDFIPDQSPVLFRVNAKQMLAIPDLRELISTASNDGKKAVSVIEFFEKNYNIKPETVLSGQVWGTKTGSADHDAALYVKTELKENKLAEIFAGQAEKSENFIFNTTTLAGEKIYTIAPQKKIKGEQTTLAIVYLAEDVLLLMPLTPSSAGTLIASRQGGKNPLLKSINRQVLLAVFARMDGEKEKIRLFDLQADIKNPVKRDLNLLLKLTCKSSEYALQLAMQTQFIVPGILGMLFSNDPVLTSSLVGGFKVKPDGKRVEIKFALSKSDQDKLIKYFSDPNNRQALIENSGVGPAMIN